LRDREEDMNIELSSLRVVIVHESPPGRMKILHEIETFDLENPLQEG
jgi:hypothetical protein